MHVVLTASGARAMGPVGSALVSQGHQVTTLRQTEHFAGATRSSSRVRRLTSALDGAEVVLDLVPATAQVPSPRWHGLGGSAAGRRQRRHRDRLRAEIVADLVEAAARAGVRRLVHASSSLVYAGAGESVLDERSPVCVTEATEAITDAEMAIAEFTSRCRAGVVLRLGLLVDNSAECRRTIGAASTRRALHSVSDPSASYLHLIHPHEVPGVCTAALQASAGVYNVGANPVSNADFLLELDRAADREDLTQQAWSVAGWAASSWGRHGEPWSRSRRVSSAAFTAETGWLATRSTFDASWICGVPDSVGAR